ncbi:MAG: c-type cytochrome domain-containing protein [Planctomycetota bacterium]
MKSRALLLALGLILFGANLATAAITPEQRAQILALNAKTVEAGKLYTEGKYVDCAKGVTEVQKELLELLKSNDRDVYKAVKPIFDRLLRAHGLLELEGAELEALPSWKDVISGKLSMPDPQPGADLVSFKDVIAPMMIKHCGNCHVTGSRGMFSMATFASLSSGVRGARVVYANDVKGSTLVELMEDGSMPPGNRKVPAEEIELLKAWIMQGAQFDGPNPTANIATYAKREGEPMQPARPRPTAKSPVGNETVSFSQDIAPVLMENCNGCHIGGQQASGGLRLDTFNQLLRGGDNGELFAGSNVSKSFLLKKLKGEAEGLQMPVQRPPLSDETIDMFATWIREGATFDGDSPDASIETVVNEGWAKNATHEELFERRKERSTADWKRVLPNDDPSLAFSEEVFVLGNVSPNKVKKVLSQIDAAIKQTKKMLRHSSRDPLVKGGITVFVLKSRYDYSEFGKMTERRELPQEWMGHWKASPLDVYAVLADGGDEMEEEQAEAIALQVVTGAYVGSFKDVPFWFAEGVARNAVLTNFKRSDERIKQWQSNMPSAMQKVDSARSLLEDRLDEEAAGLAGMALANYMMNAKRNFDGLMKLLRDGRGFKEATTLAYAPPETLINGWLGKKR